VQAPAEPEDDGQRIARFVGGSVQLRSIETQVRTLGARDAKCHIDRKPARRHFLVAFDYLDRRTGHALSGGLALLMGSTSRRELTAYDTDSRPSGKHRRAAPAPMQRGETGATAARPREQSRSRTASRCPSAELRHSVRQTLATQWLPRAYVGDGCPGTVESRSKEAPMSKWLLIPAVALAIGLVVLIRRRSEAQPRTYGQRVDPGGGSPARGDAGDSYESGKPGATTPDGSKETWPPDRALPSTEISLTDRTRQS
jgi:hypothetical protein